MKKISFIGSGFGYGAQIHTTSHGPSYMKDQYEIKEKLANKNIESLWHKTIEKKEYDLSEIDGKGKNYNAVLEHNKELYTIVKKSILEYQSEMPFIIGGDHSCALGTWFGMIDALNAGHNFGLIWIDAHMDSHVYATSPSKVYHGMPISSLLGYDNEVFKEIYGGKTNLTIHPDHIVLIGIRSYEKAEELFLNSMGVRVISAEEVKKRGLSDVFKEALSIVLKAKKGFGISFDLDAIDPIEAPGVGSPETGGLSWSEIQENLHILLENPNLQAMEVTEFNPTLDEDNKTAEIIFQIALKLGQSLNKLTNLNRLIS